MTDGEIDLKDEQDGCIEIFKVIHQSVEKMALRFKDEMRRISYVTPTSYLELLNTYKKVYKERTKFVGDAKMRLSKGLTVLADAEVEVDKLKKKLEDSQPELEKTQKEVDATKKVIAKENEDAQEVKKVVSVEEAKAAE